MNRHCPASSLSAISKGPNARGAKAHPLDGPFDVADHNPIPDAERTIEEYGDRSKKVSDGVLGGKGQRNTTDPQCAEHGRGLLTHEIQGEQDHDQYDDQAEYGTQKWYQNIIELGQLQLAVGPFTTPW